jgi:hypothetical protein
MNKPRIDYKDYLTEREHLSKYEQANYDNYEKTILTLSAAFLAFSVSFLGLLRKRPESGAELAVLTAHSLLIWSWISFASSIFFMLLSFLINAIALRTEVAELGKRLDGQPPSEETNPWTMVGYSLYFLSGISFISGLTLLLTFCAQNIHAF